MTKVFCLYFYQKKKETGTCDDKKKRKYGYKLLLFRYTRKKEPTDLQFGSFPRSMLSIKNNNGRKIESLEKDELSYNI